MKQRLAPRMPLASLKTYEPDVAELPSQVAAGKSIKVKTTIAADSASGSNAGSVSDINLELIDKSPHQPRLIFDPEAIDTLAASIEESGLISPVTVRKSEDGRFELIGGERRLRAHQILGRTSIPAFVLSDISSTDAAIGALAD